MKVLIVGKTTAWMGLHVSHILKAFRKCGHQTLCLDYKVPFEQLLPDKLAQNIREQILEKKIRKYQPDLIYFVGSWKYDLQRLKTYFKGVSAIHDLDGPRRLRENFHESFAHADLPLTASKYMQRLLAEKGITAHYLPSAVDTDYYAPGQLSAQELKRFSSEISYIGRATAKRMDYCTVLPPDELALYGDRWTKMAQKNYPELLSAVRMKRNVRDMELVAIYRASRAVLNISQEPLDKFQTILSLQCFAIPAAGGCLLAEYVEEAPEAFEANKEILLFKTRDELAELAAKCVADPAFAAGIGKAGRKRCLQCHTHEHRVKEIEKLMRG